MGQTTFEIFPAAQRDKAHAALLAAFGPAPISAITPVTGGVSGALTYRVELANRPYLLRIEGERTARRNPHQYVCMQSAADAGIAPPVRLADDASGVAIMDFLPQRSLSEYPGGVEGLVRGSAELIARLQTTPPFPALGGYLDVLSRMLAFVRGAQLFAPGLLDPHLEGFARIKAAYAWDDDALVSGHNDPNPSNILFDGTRLWLIDWETAYRNDPLTDVAILAENFTGTPALVDVLLHAWRGHDPDRVLRARLLLMRLLTRLYYACLVLAGYAAGPRVAPDADLSAPTPEEFRAATREGPHKPATRETLYVYGKMLLGGFRTGLTAPSFEEALRIAGGRDV